MSKLLKVGVSELVWGVLFWFGGLAFCTYLRTPGFLLLFSFVSTSSFCVLETFLLGRLTATREVVQLPEELLNNTALGRYFRFATVGAPSVPLVREFGGNLQRHLACLQKVVFSLSCITLSFLRFPMEGCPLFEGRFSDESLRRWRPISVRFPFWSGRLDSSHRCVAALCPLTRFFSASHAQVTTDLRTDGWISPMLHPIGLWFPMRPSPLLIVSGWLQNDRTRWMSLGESCGRTAALKVSPFWSLWSCPSPLRLRV